MKMVLNFNSYTAVMLVTAVLLAGCGSPSNSTESTRPTVTPIPVYEFVAPTEPPQLATVAALTAAANTGDNLDPELVERGRGRYEALECGTCHGVNGEGTDDGPALAGTALSEDDFISFLRSGGTIGPDHQYSTNRLSDSGGKNLYLYILSLGSE
jgi:mono/diheme cytochrome c family protein